jgi:hypothetical protein
VHDLVPHVDRRPMLLQRELDDLDRSDNSSAKAAWLCKYDLHRA